MRGIEHLLILLGLMARITPAHAGNRRAAGYEICTI